jgi:uncharacterized protein (TIGR04255 family)
MSENAFPIPSYGRPPIIEAVWSVQFAEMGWLLAPHTGVFWERIRQRYPLCEGQPPIAHVVERPGLFCPPAQSVEMMQAFPLGRQWFISPTGNELVQLQRDRFCCNWRRVRSDDVYPRYAHMREAFLKEWGEFCRFAADLGQPAPSVDQCELTYINHIPHGEGWNDTSDIGRVFPLVRWEHRVSFLGGPRTLGAKVAFDIPEIGGRLHVSLGHGQRTGADSGPTEVLILELTARGMPGDTRLDGLLDWFAAARNSIVRGFTDLTGDEMHRLWGREQ